MGQKLDFAMKRMVTETTRPVQEIVKTVTALSQQLTNHVTSSINNNKILSDQLASFGSIANTIKETIQNQGTTILKNSSQIQELREIINQMRKANGSSTSSTKNYTKEEIRKIIKEETAPTHPREGVDVSQGTGAGTDIGITRVYHLAVSRIPKDTKFDERWMSNFIDERINSSGAIVQSVSRLKSPFPDRVSKSQAFKVSNLYSGAPESLYNEKFFPLNSKFGRYRFRRKILLNQRHNK